MTALFFFFFFLDMEEYLQKLQFILAMLKQRCFSLLGNDAWIFFSNSVRMRCLPVIGQPPSACVASSLSRGWDYAATTLSF